jgi:hypothetical protein
VDGAGAIVHCAGSAEGDEGNARNVVRAGAAHPVYLFVVGAIAPDRQPSRPRHSRHIGRSTVSRALEGAQKRTTT